MADTLIRELRRAVRDPRDRAGLEALARARARSIDAGYCCLATSGLAWRSGALLKEAKVEAGRYTVLIQELRSAHGGQRWWIVSLVGVPGGPVLLSGASREAVERLLAAVELGADPQDPGLRAWARGAAA